ncbi:MAG: hypothetical protein V1929_06385 [bacterium]
MRAANSATILRNINTSDLEYAPSISGDGRTLYFHKKVGGKYVIFRATR